MTGDASKLVCRITDVPRYRHIDQPELGFAFSVGNMHMGRLSAIGGIEERSMRSPVHLINSDVIPTFEAHSARIETVLSDNSREFCGRPDQHPYELFLQLEEIKHRTTRVKRPQSNGIVERLHRTLLDEHFRVEGRRTWFETIEEMQAVLDDYLVGYNQRRPHQGRGMNGGTPALAFVEGLPKTQPQKENKPAKPKATKQAA